MSGSRKKTETIVGKLTDGTTSLTVTIQITVEADHNYGWQKAMADTSPIKAARGILDSLEKAKK